MGLLIVELRKGWFALKQGVQLASSHLGQSLAFPWEAGRRSKRRRCQGLKHSGEAGRMPTRRDCRLRAWGKKLRKGPFLTKPRTSHAHTRAYTDTHTPPHRHTTHTQISYTPQRHTYHTQSTHTSHAFHTTDTHTTH